MPKHTISGSFKVNDKVEYYLSQKELAEGWRKMLPAKKYGRDKKEDKVVNENKIHYNEVTLAQFPPYLFKYLSKEREFYYDSFSSLRLLRLSMMKL